MDLYSTGNGRPAMKPSRDTHGILIKLEFIVMESQKCKNIHIHQRKTKKLSNPKMLLLLPSVH